MSKIIKHSIRRIKLDRGSELLVVDLPGSSTISFDIIVKAGWRLCKPETAELAHLLEHVAFGGCKTYPKDDDLMYEIEKNGAMQNASTNANFITYYYRSNLDECLRIIDIAMSQFVEPLYLEETIKHEKQSVLVELSNRLEQDSDRCFALMQKRFFGDRYISYQEGIESLDNINRESIVKYWKKYFGPANCRFIVSGNIDLGLENQIVTLLNNWLKKMDVDAADLTLESYPLLPFQGKLDRLKTPRKSTEEMIYAWVWPGLHQDEVPVLRVIDTILSGGMSSVLFSKARKAGLTYSIFSDVSTNIDLTGLFIVDTVTPDKTKHLLNLIISELNKVLSGEIKDQDFSRSIGYLRGSFARGIQLPEQLSYWYAKDFVMGREMHTPQDFLNSIGAVSKEDIINLGQKRDHKKNWYLSLVSNKSHEEITTIHEMITGLNRY